MDIHSIIDLDRDELFDLANDTDRSMLCDWREGPDAVIEYANAFLPEDLRLEYFEDNDGLAFSNRIGRFSIPFDEYEGIEEPIPMLIREINKLISPCHTARYFNCLEGTDCYSYLLRPSDFWRALDSGHAAEATRIFRIP